MRSAGYGGLNEHEAIAGIGEYFRFYNRERSHQALGYQTPEAIYFSHARKACGE